MVENISITLVLALTTAILGIITFYRGVKKDVKSSTTADVMQLDPIKESLIKCNTKLDQICNTTNETRTDIKSMDAKIQDIDKRTFLLEHDMAIVFKKLEEAGLEVSHEHKT